MSNPTDTNQASEDELKVLLESNGWKFYEELNGFRKESKYTIPMFSTDQHTTQDAFNFLYYELKQVIQSAIRTEKLKLLAEVRERVVGEDKPLQGKYRASGLMSYDMTNHYENSLRAEQRAVLTQLEAEL